jgi:hypothetical protein
LAEKFISEQNLNQVATKATHTELPCSLFTRERELQVPLAQCTLGSSPSGAQKPRSQSIRVPPPLRDRTLEVSVIEWMVLDLYLEPAIAWIERWPLVTAQPCTDQPTEVTHRPITSRWFSEPPDKLPNLARNELPLPVLRFRADTDRPVSPFGLTPWR